MSVADVYASAEELMDLKLNPNNEYQLIHPYNQVRSVPNSNRREIRVFNFANGDWGKRNFFVLPPMDLRITELYVEFTLTAETDGGSNQHWQPTPTWLTLQGADLLYKNESVINMSEPECLMATLLDERENVFDAKSRLYGFARDENATVATKLYLPLNHLCNQVLSKLGAISAYDSGSWQLQVELRPQLAVLSGSSEITAPTSVMSAMRLICVGNKVPAGEILLQRQALLQNGIVWNFLRSHRFRDTIPVTNVGNTSVVTRTYTSIVGNVSHIRQIHRDVANYNSLGAADKNNVDYDAQDFYGPDCEFTVGRTSRPFDVFGQPLYPPLVNTFMAKSNMGQPRYVGLGSSSGENAVVGVDTSIRDVSFAESVCDVLHGTSTGSYPVKNDLRTSFTLAPQSANSVAEYLDTIVYTHVRGVITQKHINVNTSA